MPHLRAIRLGLVVSLVSLGLWAAPLRASPPLQADDPRAPDHVVKLIFIHHSTGENWLADENGGLGLALRENNYFVSDTNYGWGPDGIGDTTDIGHWWTWFRGPDSDRYLSAVYAESGQHSSYTRLENDPEGENEIVMFKSCFPNSGLQGSPSDPVPAIDDNPLRGQDASSEQHTLANAQGIYIDLLNYLAARPDKLFVVITAPPLIDGAWADNARAFNTWLVNDWLADYPYLNVAVFDFYNVLTDSDNHHRFNEGAIEYLANRGGNTSFYPSARDDDHPSPEGNRKATDEFVPLLNVFYHRWRSAAAAPTPETATAQPATESVPAAAPTAAPTVQVNVAPTTVAPTATSAPQPDGGGGLCGAAALPLALVGVTWLRRRKS